VVLAQCQTKAALASTEAHLASLPETKDLLLVAQKQLSELPLRDIQPQHIKKGHCGIMPSHSALTLSVDASSQTPSKKLFLQ
jgi:hypothetical protein